MEKLMDTDPYNRAMPRKLVGQDMFGDTYPTCSTTCQKQTDCDTCLYARTAIWKSERWETRENITSA